MSQSCVDCHFFVKHHRGEDGRELTFEVSPEERELCRQDDYSWQSSQYTLACAFGVWDEGHKLPKADRYNVLVEMDRRDYCFFWHHRPGMLQSAAKELQKREAEAKSAARDRKLTIRGLFIAAAALVVDALLRVLEALKFWPY